MLEQNQSMLEQNKALMKRFVEEVLNTGDVDLVPKFIAPNHVNHNDPTERSNGVAGMQKHIKVFRCTYPDVHVTVEGQIAEGDTVASRLTYRGTHQGSWLGIKPTGKMMTMRGAKIVIIRDGLIAESWGFFNTLEALREIGALKFPNQQSGVPNSPQASAGRKQGDPQ